MAPSSSEPPFSSAASVKAYRKHPNLSTDSLQVIPTVLAGYLRYLEGVDDCGNAFVQSPDPLLEELKALSPECVLKQTDVFGVDLFEDGLGERILASYARMQGVGNVRKELESL